VSFCQKKVCAAFLRVTTTTTLTQHGTPLSLDSYLQYLQLSPTKNQSTMSAPTTTHEEANWAVDRATGLPEVWALIAMHLGLVGAWRLMRVCKAARVGAKEFLSTLPGLVVCGGYSQGVIGVRVRDVWRLDLATLRWEAMPGLVIDRTSPACCAVRGTLVVLGGGTSTGSERGITSVELLSSEEGAFVDFPPLSCDRIMGSGAISVEESDSAAGQVLLLGGEIVQGALSTVHLVDLATAVCTPGRPDLLRSRFLFAAAGLPGGGIVCAGGGGDGGPQSAAEVWGAPVQGAPDAAWRQLPAMSVARHGCRGCVMSDGRFAVLGGWSGGVVTSSCEALAIGDDDAHWVSLLPMHDARCNFACAAVAGCVIVAGGWDVISAEVYDEVLGRWLRLPRDLPQNSGTWCMGSALL
jgi:hypothetical protein